jgi:hypothetical protein
VVALEFANVKIFRSQSNESELINKIIIQNNFDDKNVYFLEFGFGPTEFNCSRLSNSGISGVLIDMDRTNIDIARKILNKKTQIVEKKIEPLDLLEIAIFQSSTFNVLSIDVDGIDYEFMELALINFKLDLIVVEFNSTFGDKRVKVPFDLNFNRYSNHGSWHGASLKAFVDLAHKHNYCLESVSSNYVNALFVPSSFATKTECRKVLEKSIKDLDQSIRSISTGMTWKEQFEVINKFPLQYLENSEIDCSATII